jgi:hypothetical protein
MPKAEIEKKEMDVFNRQVKIGKSRTEALGVHYAPPKGKVSRFVKPRLHMDFGPMRTNMPLLCPVGTNVIYRRGKEELLAKVAEYRNEVCKAVIVVDGKKRIVGQESISPAVV